MGGGMGFEFVRVGERDGRRDGWRDEDVVNWYLIQ